MARVQPSQHQQEVFELDVNVRHIARSSHGPKHVRLPPLHCVPRVHKPVLTFWLYACRTPR